MDAVRAAAIGVDHPDAASLAAAATTTMLFVAAASPSSSSTGVTTTKAPQDPEGECQLLGSFALLVQAALGALALLALVYKRWRERPQRPVKIWFFDASKQVFGSVLVHVANIFMSMLTSGRFSITTVAAGVVTRSSSTAAAAAAPYVPNPCSFYLLNLGIDVSRPRPKKHLPGNSITNMSRLRSASPYSSVSCTSSLRSSRAHLSVSPASRSSPATTARRPARCGG